MKREPPGIPRKSASVCNDSTKTQQAISVLPPGRNAPIFSAQKFQVCDLSSPTTSKWSEPSTQMVMTELFLSPPSLQKDELDT